MNHHPDNVGNPFERKNQIKVPVLGREQASGIQKVPHHHFQTENHIEEKRK